MQEILDAARQRMPLGRSSALVGLYQRERRAKKLRALSKQLALPLVELLQAGGANLIPKPLQLGMNALNRFDEKAGRRCRRF